VHRLWVRDVRFWSTPSSRSESEGGLRNWIHLGPQKSNVAIFERVTANFHVRTQSCSDIGETKFCTCPPHSTVHWVRQKKEVIGHFFLMIAVQVFSYLVTLEAADSSVFILLNLSLPTTTYCFSFRRQIDESPSLVIDPTWEFFSHWIYPNFIFPRFCKFLRFTLVVQGVCDYGGQS